MCWRWGGAACPDAHHRHGDLPRDIGYSGLGALLSPQFPSLEKGKLCGAFQNMEWVSRSRDALGLLKSSALKTGCLGGSLEMWMGLERQHSGGWCLWPTLAQSLAQSQGMAEWAPPATIKK